MKNNIYTTSSPGSGSDSVICETSSFSTNEPVIRNMIYYFSVNFFFCSSTFKCRQKARLDKTHMKYSINWNNKTFSHRKFFHHGDTNQNHTERDKWGVIGTKNKLKK